MLSGMMQGLIAGTEKLVFDYEVSGSAVTTIPTGVIFNGEEDGWCTIIARLVGGNANSSMWIRPNGDSGANCGRLGIQVTSTTVANFQASSEDGVRGIYTASAGQITMAVARVYLKSGSVRLFNLLTVRSVSGTTVTEVIPMSGVWNNVNDIVSNFVFAGATGDLGIGTRIFVLKQNLFSNGRPHGGLKTPYIKGGFTRIDSKLLAASANTLTFDKLDGDRDVIYLLSASAKMAGGSFGMGARPNNDSSTSNYGQQVIRLVSGAISGQRFTSGMLNITYVGTAVGSYLHTIFLLYAKSGYLRTSLAFTGAGFLGTTPIEVDIYGNVWTNTTDNIRTLVLDPNGAGSWDIGSRFDLYALRPNG